MLGQYGLLPDDRTDYDLQSLLGSVTPSPVTSTDMTANSLMNILGGQGGEQKWTGSLTAAQDRGANSTGALAAQEIPAWQTALRIVNPLNFLQLPFKALRTLDYAIKSGLGIPTQGDAADQAARYIQYGQQKKWTGFDAIPQDVQETIGRITGTAKGTTGNAMSGGPTKILGYLFGDEFDRERKMIDAAKQSQSYLQRANAQSIFDRNKAEQSLTEHKAAWAPTLTAQDYDTGELTRGQKALDLGLDERYAEPERRARLAYQDALTTRMREGGGEGGGLSTKGKLTFPQFASGLMPPKLPPGTFTVGDAESRFNSVRNEASRALSALPPKDTRGNLARLLNMGDSPDAVAAQKAIQKLRGSQALEDVHYWVYPGDDGVPGNSDDRPMILDDTPERRSAAYGKWGAVPEPTMPDKFDMWGQYQEYLRTGILPGQGAAAPAEMGSDSAPGTAPPTYDAALGRIKAAIRKQLQAEGKSASSAEVDRLAARQLARMASRR